MDPPTFADRKIHTQPKSIGKVKEKGGRNLNPSHSTKLRGRDQDSAEVRMSKTIAWLLRHQAENEGLIMRSDGYVKVEDILEHPKVKATGLDFYGLKRLVESNDKKRFDLILDGVDSKSGSGTLPEDAEGSTQKSGKAVWWIKAQQGHSIKTVQVELKPISSLADIPTGIVVHGTNRNAWEIISQGGLSKMNRNHIHMAQGVTGKTVVSGMRASSQILVYVDIEKAMAGGLKFWLSANGVILSEGDENGGWEEISSTIPPD